MFCCCFQATAKTPGGPTCFVVALTTNTIGGPTVLLLLLQQSYRSSFLHQYITRVLR